MANWLSKPFQWADKQLFGSGAPNSYGGAIDAAGATAHSLSTRANNDYLNKAEGFDAQAGLREAAGGLFDQFEGDVGKKITALRGQEVGAGRLGGGYGAQDEDATVYDARRDLNDQISSMALQSEGLDLQNTNGLRQFGSDQGNDYLSVLAGQQDSETGRYNAQQQKKAGFWGSVADLAGDAFATFGPKPKKASA